jgi:hypothetical protein
MWIVGGYECIKTNPKIVEGSKSNQMLVCRVIWTLYKLGGSNLEFFLDLSTLHNFFIYIHSFFLSLQGTFVCFNMHLIETSTYLWLLLFYRFSHDIMDIVKTLKSSWNFCAYCIIYSKLNFFSLLKNDFRLYATLGYCDGINGSLSMHHSA